MKKAEALALVEQGKVVMFLEYRNSVADIVQYRDKNTGKPASFPKLVHNCELGNVQVQVSERVGEGFDPVHYKATFTKGQRVVGLLTGFQMDSGVAKCNGTLQLLEG